MARSKEFDIEVRNLIITIHTQSDGRTIISEKFSVTK